ncbi:lipocalin family protein [Vibrio sp. F74]|uniref:lipocalin family protein n=1 Tax=Vibrio sp. F74 TaxID=700020 RepID=UPI0035F54DF2
MKELKNLTILIICILTLTGCTGKPNDIEPVANFALDNYLGKWYELARLDHSFERGLNNVSATYSVNDDGSVRVINRGWKKEDKEWSEAEGKAKFVTTPDIAHLKVSFFGPFYGSYIVFYIEPDYSTALISGYNTDYFWILSRTPTIAQDKMDKYIMIAKAAGFNTSELIFPTQEPK